RVTAPATHREGPVRETGPSLCARDPVNRPGPLVSNPTHTPTPVRACAFGARGVPRHRPPDLTRRPRLPRWSAPCPGAGGRRATQPVLRLPRPLARSPPARPRVAPCVFLLHPCPARPCPRRRSAARREGVPLAVAVPAPPQHAL